jgi:TPR repeat protein
MNRPFIIFLFLAPAILARADDSLERDRAKAILRDMQSTSTWYHDDLFGQFAGFRYYAQHRYADALHYFELGAYYADKPSQISVGLMYLKGEGVTGDPATALAWIELASERGYPAYIATLDRVKATLTPDELTRAKEVHEKLAEKYGDAVAKPRIAEELRAGLRLMTGSHAGFDAGAQFLPLEAIYPEHTSAPGSMDVRTICPHGFWAAECWKPELYFAMRDRQLNATVTVGPVQGQK